jgi:phage I-like protein
MNELLLPYPNEHAARLRDPDDFNDKSFRRVNGGTIYGSIKVPSTIVIIWGKLKEAAEKDDPVIPQALRFPTKNYTEVEAKKWLKENKIKYISFEKAEPVEDQQNSETQFAVREKFVIEDCETYRKGMTEKQKGNWVSAANEAFASCMAGKGNQLNCEIAAIRHANSMVNKKQTKAADPKPVNVEEVEGRRITTQLRLDTQLAINQEDQYQMILPVGTFYSGYYGEIIITPTFCQVMLQNWKDQVMGNRQPFIDTLHDRGKANGWITDLQVRADGLYAVIDWTPMGKENVQQGYYKYFSSDIGEVVEINSGEQIFPVLIAVALCNTPVMNTMPQAKLNDELNAPLAHSDGGDKHIMEVPMEPKEFLETITKMSDTEKAQLLSILTPKQESKQETKPVIEKPVDFTLAVTEAVKAAFVQLSNPETSAPGNEQVTSNATLQSKVNALEKANQQIVMQLKDVQTRDAAKRKKEVIEKALSEGKIWPKNRAMFEEAFDKDPDWTTKMLEDMPKAISLGEEGTESVGMPGIKMTAQERKMQQIFGIKDETLVEETKGK